MAKSTDAEKDKRVTEVYTMLIHNKTRTEILQYSAETWNVKERQVDNYISEANQMILEDNAGERDIAVASKLASLRDLYKRSYEDADYKECRAVLAEMNKVSGLYAPTKTESTNKNFDMSDDDIRRELRKLEAMNDEGNE